MVFVAGVALTAAALNAAAPTGDTSFYLSNDGTTTSTSYTDTLTGSTTASLAFVAPPSGKIEVTIAVLQENTTSTTQTSFRISGAAGTVAASDDYSVQSDDSNTRMGEKTTQISGLTAGAAGTVTMQHKVAGGTGTFDKRAINIRMIAG